MSQCLIREYDIRRNLFLLRNLRAQSPQLLKQRFLALCKLSAAEASRQPLPALLSFFALHLCRVFLLLRHLHDNRLFLFQNRLRLLRQLNDGVFVIGHAQILLELKVIHHLAEFIGRHLGKLCIVGIFVHTVLTDLCRIGAVDRIDNHVGPIPLPAALHASDELHGNLRHIHRFELTQTVGTVSAVILSIFSEIPKDIISQALIGKAVKCHLPQPFPVSLLDDGTGHGIQFLIIPVIIDKQLVCNHILAAVQQDTLRRFPVSACPARFLVIALHILRHVVMDDKPDIGFINSHSERVGRNNDSRPVVNEVLLIFLPLRIAQSRVIPGNRESICPQLLADLLHIFPGQAVDHSALPWMKLQKILHRLILVFRRLDAEIEIRPVKSRGQNCRLPQHQDIADIIPYLFCGRSRKGTDHWAYLHPFDKLHNL